MPMCGLTRQCASSAQSLGSDEPSDCALDAHCRVKPHMGIVGAKVRGALHAVSFQELAS